MDVWCFCRRTIRKHVALAVGHEWAKVVGVRANVLDRHAAQLFNRHSLREMGGVEGGGEFWSDHVLLLTRPCAASRNCVARNMLVGVAGRGERVM